MKKIVYAVLAFAPALAFAQANLSGISSLVASFAGILTQVIPIMFALAIIFFFWGLVQFLRAGGDPKAKETGRNHMIWGVIAIAVMVSIYGLVTWLQTAVGIGNQTSIPLPTVQGL